MTTTISVIPALMAANAANIAARLASQDSTCTSSINPWLGNAILLVVLVAIGYMAYDMFRG